MPTMSDLSLASLRESRPPLEEGEGADLSAIERTNASMRFPFHLGKGQGLGLLSYEKSGRAALRQGRAARARAMISSTTLVFASA
jgi:hypothetical protein